MKNDKFIVQVIGSLLAGGILLGGVAFAVDKESNVTKDKFSKIYSSKMTMRDKFKCKKIGIYGEKGQEFLQQTLDSLLKDKTIDQKQVDDIKAYINQKVKEKETSEKELEKLTLEERKGFFRKKITERRANKGVKKSDIVTELVKEKIITQKQGDEFNKKFQVIMISKQQQRVAKILNDLVDKKAINRNQADKITKEITAFHNERKAIKDKLKDMSKEERRDFMKNNKKDFKNPINKLVEEKVITEKQANDIKEALSFNKGFQKKFHKGAKYSLR